MSKQQSSVESQKSKAKIGLITVNGKVRAIQPSQAKDQSPLNDSPGKDERLGSVSKKKSRNLKANRHQVFRSLQPSGPDSSIDNDNTYLGQEIFQTTLIGTPIKYNDSQRASDSQSIQNNPYPTLVEPMELKLGVRVPQPLPERAEFVSIEE